MLDLKALRADPDGARAALERRGEGTGARLDRVLELDERRRSLLPRVEDLRAEAKRRSKDVGAKMKELGALPPEQAAEQRAQITAWAKEPAVEAESLRAELEVVEAEFNEALLLVPNLPDPTAAPEDTVIREVTHGSKWLVEGGPGFEPKDHLELSGDLVDMERAARLSGSRFAYLKGDLVMLELALVQWVLSKLGGQGFTPVIPPVLVREQALLGTGFLPDTEQQIYTLPADDLYLVGTSEVALASLHAGEILDVDELPLRYAGYSPCFRREAGAAGAADKGLFRVHQFDKVEMFAFVEPSMAKDEHERILAIEESILTDLELPYQVVNIAVDDLGPSAAKKFDCEVWLPSQGRWRELTSCSNTTEFQARRLDARYRPKDEDGKPGKPEAVATLNGTATAVGRTIIAILENHQQEDGSVAIPAALHAFGAPKVISAS
ncbi:MAG: serine--tRNA ligase [Solirubrobacteraceae bacterium]|nr:serine--tRNA ligase [Solirubrobacteraceae bacterium]